MREVEMLMRRDAGANRIAFVDVAAPDYSPEANAGINFEAAMERIHAVLPDGTVVTGEWGGVGWRGVGVGWRGWGWGLARAGRRQGPPEPRAGAHRRSAECLAHPPARPPWSLPDLQQTCPHAPCPSPAAAADVEVFRRLYEEVGLGWVYAVTKYKPVEALANK